MPIIIGVKAMGVLAWSALGLEDPLRLLLKGEVGAVAVLPASISPTIARARAGLLARLPIVIRV